MSKTFPEIASHGEQPTRTPGTDMNYQIIVSQQINFVLVCKRFFK